MKNTGSTLVSNRRLEKSSNKQSRTLEIFRDDLKPLGLPNTTRTFLTADIRSSSVSGLEDGLSLLLDSINDKKPFSDMMQIVHGPVHTIYFWPTI